MTDNKNLVIRSEQHLMAQVEAANTRLAISSQLTQDVERRRFVEILKHIENKNAVHFLAGNSFLDNRLLEKYQDYWWEWGVSNNEVLPWSLELIEKYQNKWDWKKLSKNRTLPWSIELIKRFKNK